MSAGRSAARVLLVVLSLLGSSLITEGLLRTVLEPSDFLRPDLARDEALGFRIEPNSGGHDAWGFRNPVVPPRADIVTIGDSFTYGSMVRAADSWPAVLAALSGRTVYNLGTPGYGPLQYAELLDSKALRLKPDWVIVALYYGNDFLDASARDTPRADDGSGLVHWLQTHSFVYRILDGAFSELSRQVFIRSYRYTSRSRDYLRIADRDNRVYTTLAKGRMRGVDLGRPEVRRGIEATAGLLRRMNRRCRDHGGRLLVVLLPTKESIFAGYLSDHGAPDDARDFSKLERNERTIDEQLQASLRNDVIPYVNLREAFLSTVGHEEIYPRHFDGHLNRNGHRLFAEQVLRVIDATSPRS